MSMIDDDLVGTHQKEPVDAASGGGGGGSVALRATNLSTKKAQPPQPAKEFVIKLLDDDIFAGVAAKNNNARAGGRFQPRAKRGPVKKQPAATSRSSSQSCVDNVPTVAAPNEESSKPHEDKCAEVLYPLEHVTTQEKVDHTAESLAETGQHSGLENSFGENADIACPHSTTEAPAIPVFQSPEDGFAPAVISCPPVLDSSSSGSTFILSKKDHDIVCPESSPIEDPLTSCPESPLNEDPLTGGHPIVSVSEGSSLMHDGRSVIKQVESYPCLEILDTPDITSYGPCIGKFQPKPKIHEARSKVCTPNPEVLKSGVCENHHLDPSEFQNTLSKCHEDDVLDLSSLGFENSVPLEPAFQQPVQDMSLEQPVQDERNTEAVCDMHESMGTREAKGQQPSTSTSRQLSRPHRKCNNGRKLVDESEDEERNEMSVDPGELVVHQDDDKELQVNNKNQEKKKLRKRSNKPVVDKEKPVRKHKKAGEATNQDSGTNRKAGEATNQDTGTNKKAGEATNQDTGTKSKKFPHSTRQRKRRVDQTLLETPEDLIEYQKVPLRDLIILADYKERMTKKTATTSQVPSTGQSMGSTSTQNNDYLGIPSENVEVPVEALFNYHTYMEKTPRAKWLEQDTELFYQGIRQFGTDLSMIQQLFPGLTRNQIKSKYKKEEKQHPLRLCEALTNRPNDFSHFQQVIANMKKVADENQQTDSKAESVDLVDDEHTEQISETIDEAAKSEQQVEQGDAEVAEEAPVKSPPVSYESEDDLDFDWSQYNSEV